MKVRSRCRKAPHTVDCSEVPHIRQQREYCVTDAAYCLKNHELVQKANYRRKGAWNVAKEEKAALRRAERRAELAEDAGKLAKVAAKAGARAAASEAQSAASALVSGTKATARIADKSVRAAWRLGKRSVKRTRYFYEQYSDILESYVGLPDENDKRWKDPPYATELLQKALEVWRDKEAARRRSSKETGKQLDLWQKAVAIPVRYVKELLVVADTGTGKSLVWANAARIWHEMDLRIVVLVNDQQQGQNQFKELLASPSWSDVEDLRRLVSVGERHKTKPIQILTYVQAGNMVQDFRTKRPLDKSELDGVAIIMDEVHELATPEHAKGWADSMRAVVEWLQKRRYGRLLGLTATPLVTIPAFLTLLEQFTPPKMHPVTVNDLALTQDDPTADEAACGLGGKQTVSKSLSEVFNGLRVFYYSADRDTADFAIFKPPEVLIVDVPVRSPDTFSVQRKGGWTPAALEHHIRLNKIVTAAAPVLWERLDVRRKTLVFMSTKGMATSMFGQLKSRNGGGKYSLMLLTDEAAPSEMSRTKARFGAAAPNTVLVTHLKFATGHTFDDTDAPSGLGARLLISVQMRTLKAVIQMEGRARRRRTHSKYDHKDRNIERVVLIPRAKMEDKKGAVKECKSSRTKAACTGDCEWVKGKGCVALATTAKKDVAPKEATAAEMRRTCEQVFADVVETERSMYESILRALYLVSYGRDAFWKMRPSFVEHGRGGAPEDPTRTQRVMALLKAGYKRADAMSRAGWRAAWYDAD